MTASCEHHATSHHARASNVLVSHDLAIMFCIQDMPEIKRWDEGSKEIIAEMLTGTAGDWAA